MKRSIFPCKQQSFWGKKKNPLRYLTALKKQHRKKPSPYLTKELDRSPVNPTAAPTTAVFRQPYMSVKMLTIGLQKKIIPMDREFTHAAKGEGTRQVTLTPRDAIHT